MMRRIAPACIAALVASAITAAATSPLDFWNTNHRLAAPLDIRTDTAKRFGKDRSRIHQAATKAAQDHRIPVEFMHRLVMRESGYRFVQGPPTKWGRAQGPFQMLCSTARELGENDCSRLMRDAQRSADLSARYIRQGYEATGSWAGAAAYYHGGSNTRIWGPKTMAYAKAVGGYVPPKYARAKSPNAPIAHGLAFGDTRILAHAAFTPTTFTVISGR
jgi:hypothetical protein